MSEIHYYETVVQEDLDVGVGVVQKRNPAGGVLPGTQVGVHSLAVGQAATAAIWNPSSVPSLGTTTTDVTVSGAALGDFVLVSFTLNLSGLLLSASVISSNTVRVTLFNPTTAAVDLGSGSLEVLVLKSR